MAKSFGGSKSLNLVLVVFSFLVVAGAAYFLSSNKSLIFNPSARLSLQQMTGKLIKRGSSEFNMLCGAGKQPLTLNYALVGARVLGLTTTNATGNLAMAVPPGPTMTPVAGTMPPPPSPVASGSQEATSNCTLLSVTSSLANPFIGKSVIVGGYLRSGVFYVTAIRSSITVTPAPSGRFPRRTFPTPTPTLNTPKPVPTSDFDFSHSQCAAIGGNCIGVSSCNSYGGNVGTGYLCNNTPYSCCKFANPIPTPQEVFVGSPTPVPTSFFQ